jgi:hypothetical protein
MFMGGASRTCRRRLDGWQEAGVFEQLHRPLLSTSAILPPQVGGVGDMGSDEDKKAAAALAGQVYEVGHAPDGTPWQRMLRRLI